MEPTILTVNDLAVLNRSLQGCADAQCVIDKLKQAGLPVDDLQHELDGQRRLATALKSAFFPHDA